MDLTKLHLSGIGFLYEKVAGRVNLCIEVDAHAVAFLAKNLSVEAIFGIVVLPSHQCPFTRLAPTT